MKYKLIIFDIDGTITPHISSWRFLHEKLKAWDALAYRYQEQFLSGKISYRKFCELDAAHWKGLEDDKVRKLFRTIPYSKNAMSSIKKLKKAGFKLAAVSTGIQYMTERVKDELGFDFCLSNRLNVRRGRLTGGVTINITHGAKGKVLKKILKDFRVQPREVISIGDSDGDIPLIKLSGYSVAFNSSSERLSRLVDYDCRTGNFKDVLERILSVAS